MKIKKFVYTSSALLTAFLLGTTPALANRGNGEMGIGRGGPMQEGMGMGLGESLGMGMKLGMQKMNRNAGIVNTKTDSEITITTYSPFGDKSTATFKVTSETEIVKMANDEENGSTYADVQTGDRIMVRPARAELTDEQGTQIKEIKDWYKDQLTEIRKSDSVSERRTLLKAANAEMKEKMQEVMGTPIAGQITVVPADYTLE